MSLLLGGALSLLVFFHMTCLLVEWGTEAIERSLCLCPPNFKSSSVSFMKSDGPDFV